MPSSISPGKYEARVASDRAHESEQAVVSAVNHRDGSVDCWLRQFTGQLRGQRDSRRGRGT